MIRRGAAILLGFAAAPMAVSQEMKVPDVTFSNAAVSERPIGDAPVQIDWTDGGTTTKADIVASATTGQTNPIVMDELTLLVGLMADVRNPYYETRSVFSENSNSVQKRGAQDSVVLALHDPAD